MTDAEPRSTEQRKADTLAKLTAPAADVWVATAAAQAGGHASSYMVPLSLAWADERVVLATEADSVTARNLTSERRARLGLGPTRDVAAGQKSAGRSGCTCGRRPAHGAACSSWLATRMSTSSRP